MVRIIQQCNKLPRGALPPQQSLKSHQVGCCSFGFPATHKGLDHVIYMALSNSCFYCILRAHFIRKAKSLQWRFRCLLQRVLVEQNVPERVKNMGCHPTDHNFTRLEPLVWDTCRLTPGACHRMCPAGHVREQKHLHHQRRPHRDGGALCQHNSKRDPS